MQTKNGIKSRSDSGERRLTVGIKCGKMKTMQQVPGQRAAEEFLEEMIFRGAKVSEGSRFKG